jgi:hypothetical protein
VLQPCDITYDVVWREAATGTEHALVSWTNHFDPPASGFNAVPFEADGAGVAAAAKANDQLVLRFTANGDPAKGQCWIPNGDGASTMGRDPSLTLPK